MLSSYKQMGQHCPHIFYVYDISYGTAPVVLGERILTACHCFFFEILPPQNSRLPPTIWLSRLKCHIPQSPLSRVGIPRQRGPCRKGDTPSTSPILRMQKQLAADERVLQDRGNVPTRKYLGAVSDTSRKSSFSLVETRAPFWVPLRTTARHEPRLAPASVWRCRLNKEADDIA